MMSKLASFSAFATVGLAQFWAFLPASADDSIQSFAWRGPKGDGVCPETYQGWAFDEKPAWTFEMKGRGTPVVADGKMFVFGYQGEGTEVEETLTCIDAKTSKQIWQHAFRDYISDTIYDRYSIGAAAIDPETKNVYLQTTNGRLLAFSAGGEILWQHSMMERFGRLTFPNGRTGAPVVEGGLVIMHCITSYWGKQGPARDRFYGFDKLTGDIVWVSTPGIRPRDSSYSTPVVESRYGTRVFYAGTGCGNIVCVNALNGKPLWRFHLGIGGVNASPVLYKNLIIAPHGKENLDNTDEGRMVGFNIPVQVDLSPAEPVLLEPGTEAWRAEPGGKPIASFTSSPTLVGDRVYQISKVGELHCIKADSGEVLWSKKLGNDNLHSSPLYCDGKLYVPIFSGKFYVIEPSDAGAKILHTLELEGNLIGSPAIWNGHLYLHTTKQLYCWKFKQSGVKSPPWPTVDPGKPGAAAELRAVPSDVLLQPGDSQKLTLQQLDAAGHVVGTSDSAEFAKFIPPTAKVQTEMDASFSKDTISTTAAAKTSAGAWKGSDGEVGGIFRGRVLAAIPFAEDFEGYNTVIPSPVDVGETFAYPPLPWIGARFKWEVRELDGNKVLRKTLDRVLFQRAMTLIGHPGQKNYTMQADVMTDGNRRTKSDVGLVNQRYLIVLKGNQNKLEVNSNQERLRVSVPFPVKYKTWYTLKCRVDLDAAGDATVRAKVWPKADPEPAAWTLEVPHKKGHRQGAPGLFGFSPQSLKPVYIDNISITPSK